MKGIKEPDANAFRTLGVSTLLDKPFTQQMLVKVLKQTLAN